MEITLHYKDDLDKGKILSAVKKQGWLGEIEVFPSMKRIIASVADGGDDDAEAFAIAERYRGRKVVIDA